MPISSEVAHLRARKAAEKRHHPDADTTDLDRELATLTLAAYIKRVVESAPPLNDDQRARLAMLLNPGGGVGHAA
ncbi:hypothetical protein [Streptomyces sp. NPDC058268]|uniref:hypothetical protein n=1 Tax=Streptomyces sp. NPDC058268 TaxID=3346413 RepID=UPI0036EC10B7